MPCDLEYFHLFGAHGLVEIFLRQMEDNQRQNNAFEQAHYDWKQTCQQIRDQWQDFRLHIEDTPEFSRAYRTQLKRALMEANKTLGYAAMSKLPDKLWARRIAMELKAETALDDEITKLLHAQSEALAQQADAMAVVPANFSNGS